MLESLFTGILPLILLLFVVFFITVTLHELGHAVPALIMTRDEITIYIGSLGDTYKSFHFSFGRLTFFCKYNPFLWYRGCCVVPAGELSIDQELWFVAGGPIASILGTLASWLLVSVAQQIDFLRVVSGGVFVISLLVSLYILFPNPMARYTPSGYPVYSDTYQIYRLLKVKFR
jgi:hypothetical protein